MDINPTERGADGREARGRTGPKPRLGRTSPSKDTGRLQGGRGKRGFWVRKREKQLGGRSKVQRVKGLEFRREESNGSRDQPSDPAQTQTNAEDQTGASQPN